jgi:hypothetical protein
MRVLRLVTSVVLLTMLVAANTQAQSRLGILGGVSFASQHMDGAQGFKGYTGGFGGAAFDWSISNDVSIRPEVLYVMKGGKPEIGYNDGFKLGDLEVPVLIKWKSDQFHIYGGPVYVRNLSCKITGASETDCANQDTFTFEKNGLNGLFGLGFDFKVLSFGARYDAALRDTGHTPAGELKTNTIQVYAGVGFSFSGKK